MKITVIVECEAEEFEVFLQKLKDEGMECCGAIGRVRDRMVLPVKLPKDKIDFLDNMPGVLKVWKNPEREDSDE